MPTYDYICSSCQHKFEEILKIAEKEIPNQSPCPNCKKVNCIETVMGAPPIGDPIRLGRKKPSSTYLEKMKIIKKNHPGGSYRY
jgi:putative FmdB family regulatory protein